MDFHPPQGAHTSHLRTLSKIVYSLPDSHQAPRDFSSEGAAHYTSRSKAVNSSRKKFFRTARGGLQHKERARRSQAGRTMRARALRCPVLASKHHQAIRASWAKSTKIADRNLVSRPPGSTRWSSPNPVPWKDAFSISH